MARQLMMSIATLCTLCMKVSIVSLHHAMQDYGSCKSEMQTMLSCCVVV